MPAELTYGLERLAAFLQVQGQRLRHRVDARRSVRRCPVRGRSCRYSVYNFEMADVATLWQLFDLYEGKRQRLLDLRQEVSGQAALSVLPAYDQVLKCSNMFNLLDARGAISVTERVGVIGRVRKLAVGVAQLLVDQQPPNSGGGMSPSFLSKSVPKKFRIG